MKARLILKDKDNHFITANIDIKMQETEGLYYDGAQGLMDFNVVGIQWLPEEKLSDELPPIALVTVNCSIEKTSVDTVRETVEKALKAMKAGSAL